MARTSNRAGDVVRTFRSVADLLEEPQLAQIYACFARGEVTTVQDVADELDLAQGRAFSYVDRLVHDGVVAVTDDEQPRRYVAREIDLTVRSATGDGEYTITPALVDAVARRETNDDVDAYVDRHGVGGLATALTCAVARERGEVTRRTVAEDLDVSPQAAESVLQALRPVVHEFYDVEASGASLEALGDGGRDATEDL